MPEINQWLKENTTAKNNMFAWFLFLFLWHVFLRNSYIPAVLFRLIRFFCVLSVFSSVHSRLLFSDLFKSILWFLFHSFSFYFSPFHSILCFAVLFCSLLFSSTLFSSILFSSILFWRVLFSLGRSFPLCYTWVCCILTYAIFLIALFVFYGAD
jgi:hypothetical protein